MFNNIFSEIKGKKVIQWGEAGGNGGTVLIMSWKCNFSIYLDIQAITTLYAFYWFFMCWFLLYIHFYMLQPISWKVTFSGTQKCSQPTVFNLQSLDWLRCEEETGAHYSISRRTSKLVSFFYEFWKLLILAQKNTRFSKNSIKFFWFFFSWIYMELYVYMYYMQW